MKYMLLMQCTQSQWDSLGTWTPEDLKTMIQFMTDLDKELADSGELVTAEGLAEPSQTKIVQARRDGAPVITDGPFPETKEFLAGWWVLDCATEDRMLEIAGRISAQPGQGGKPANIPVEIRPVGQAPQV
ncbi:MAG: YciI family protein [Mycobacteriales bacterium]